MTWLGRALTGVAIVAALCGVFQWQYPTYSYRFRVTIEIEAPDGLRSGSSVLQVKTVQYPSWITLGANGSRTSVEGEAILVDLGGGRALVGLLVFGNVGQYSIIDLPVQAILGKTRYGHSYQPDWTRELSRNSQRFQLEPKLYPLLMVFPDIARPDSGIVVTGDNLVFWH